MLLSAGADPRLVEDACSLPHSTPPSQGACAGSQCAGNAGALLVCDAPVVVVEEGATLVRRAGSSALLLVLQKAVALAVPLKDDAHHTPWTDLVCSTGRGRGGGTGGAGGWGAGREEERGRFSCPVLVLHGGVLCRRRSVSWHSSGSRACGRAARWTRVTATASGMRRRYGPHTQCPDMTQEPTFVPPPQRG